jgi:BlaI family transcriptional regulator, penicillinase repressor
MQKLTKAEESLMQIIWRLGRCTVTDVIEQLGEPRPPHGSISSLVRIIEKKGFLDHKAYGKTHEYFPIIGKEIYGKATAARLISDYFEGSALTLVSALMQDEKVDTNELKLLISRFQDEKNA